MTSPTNRVVPTVSLIIASATRVVFSLSNTRGRKARPCVRAFLPPQGQHLGVFDDQPHAFEIHRRRL